MPQQSAPVEPFAGRSRPSSPTFSCLLRDGGGEAAWVQVTGELDMATAVALDRTLRRAERRARLVVLDLRELIFMDSAGVHVIVDASIRGLRAGRRLTVVRGPAQVDRLFALAKGTDAVELVDLQTAEPAAQVVLQLAREDHAA